MYYYLLDSNESHKDKGWKPFLLGLDTRHISKKQGDIGWMVKGGGVRSDYHFVKRIGKYTFECEATKKVFEIKDRGTYTEKAWDEFINQWKD